MLHASKFQPRIIPIFGTGDPAEIDRAQDITPTGTLNREKVNEIGRVGTVGFVKKTPSITYDLNQLEYGSFEFWRKVANVDDSATTITQEDFKTAAVDICAFLTDDDGTFLGTLLYPNLRTSGFELTIGSPDDTIARSFNLVGEQSYTYKGAAPYYISLDKTVASSGDNTIDCSARVPAIDPDAAAGATDAVKYIYRVVRTRSGVSTKLNPDVTGGYTYSNSTNLITVDDAEVDDFYRVWYASATAPATLFTNNDSDPAGLNADVASIYLYVPGSGKPSGDDYLYRLQSVTISPSLTRDDKKEIGNKDVVLYGVSETACNVTLGSIMGEMTMEEALRGVDSDYTKIDISKFSDDITLIVRIYEDNTKETLKWGFNIPNLSPTDINQGASANAYVTKGATLEGEEFTLSTDTTELGSL